MGAPELALEALGAKFGGLEVNHIWRCDIWAPCIKWLQNMDMPGPVLKDMNARVWALRRGAKSTMQVRDVRGVPLTFHEGSVDLYVCGFMCTPFTPNGQRQGWADEHSKTFWSALKTVKTVKPTVFVLENVKAIGRGENARIVKDALAQLTDYVICHLTLTSTSFGVPQTRTRVFIVGFIQDALAPNFQGRSQKVIEAYLDKQVRKCCTNECPPFPDWLKALGCPLVPNRSEGPGADLGCVCQVKKWCELHKCACNRCQKLGTKRLACNWRACMVRHMALQSYKKKVVKHLNLWRKIRKDPKLKSSPDYFDLARKKGLSTELLRGPRQRCILKLYNRSHNIMSKCTVLNLNKSLGHTSLRADGCVPTLGHGCGGLFVPSIARFLTAPQLMCLSGFHPALNERQFEAAMKETHEHITMMLGNTICLPVIGSVIACACSVVSV